MIYTLRIDYYFIFNIDSLTKAVIDMVFLFLYIKYFLNSPFSSERR